MTVKKRLFLSNLLMILVPVAISALIALFCVGGVWYAASHGMSFGFEDREDFYETSEVISEVLEQALKAPEAQQTQALEELCRALDPATMAVRISKEGQGFFTYGADAPGDDALIEALSALGGEGMVSSRERNLFAHVMARPEGAYQIYLFSGRSQMSHRALKLALVGSVLVVLAAVVFSILFTNRFLTRFVWQKIEHPLDVLAGGVHQIRDGNLDCRIDYDQPDEFAPVCADFNEMALRLKASVEQTRRQEESRKELMAGISHDLRSPLTSIQAYVEGLLDGVPQTPQAREKYLRTIKSKAEDIQRMVSQIFLFSKMELEEYPIHLEPLRLDAFIRSLLDDVSPDYAARGLRIAAELCPSPVEADPAEVHRVLTNILDNSVKYRTKEEGHLAISLAPGQGGWLLRLTDDGPGVPPQALPKLFDVFYRSDPSRQNPHQGSGLGLSIAARAIQRMGGTIRAENAPEGGLSLLIWLPQGKEENG